MGKKIPFSVNILQIYLYYLIAATAQFIDLPIATCDEKFESVKTATVIVLQAVENDKF